MPPDVGQRLLHDPVRGQLDARIERGDSSRNSRRRSTRRCSPSLGNRLVYPPAHIEALRALHNVEDAGLAVQAGVLMADIAEDQAPMLERLRQLGPPTAEVPLIAWRQHDLDATRRIAAEIEASVQRLSGASEEEG